MVSGVALAGPWRRDPFGPPGAVALITVLVAGLDMMTRYRLQLGAPFGLSVLEGGRFYGIGGEGIGLYAVCVYGRGGPGRAGAAAGGPGGGTGPGGGLPPRPRSRASR